MDPLSDLIFLLRPAATISLGFAAGGNWSIDFAGQHGQIKCYSILSGGCWMAVEGVKEPVRLEQGDAFVLPRGRPFRLASDLSLPATDAATLFPPARPGSAVILGTGETFSLAGARFTVNGSHAELILGLLPPVMHLRRALQSMHAEPARRWTLLDLGSEAGMSRTIFATRFREVMGETPMRYLACWRMVLACDRLEHSAESITELASSLGYESISAFSTAFKRILGHSPPAVQAGRR